MSNITNKDNTFNYVVSQLDTCHTVEVEDIITNLPPLTSYQHLRTTFIERLSTSEKQRVYQLINEEELGDQKRSQFLRHFRSLDGNIMLQDNLLRYLWLRRLPFCV